MSRNSLIKYLGAGAAAVVLAFGAYAIGSSGSGNTTGNASAAQSAQAPPAAGGAGGANGAGPRQGGPGGGTIVTGTAATKAGDAATAKYPGTVEGVMGLPDGSYLVHVLASSGEVHVHVSKDFAVTGVQQGGRPGGMPGGTPPSAGSGGSTS